MQLILASDDNTSDLKYTLCGLVGSASFQICYTCQNAQRSRITHRNIT